MQELLCLGDVSKYYGRNRQTRVLEHVNLRLDKGSIMGLIGETGQGKTTLARIIIGLEKADQGEIRFKGNPLLPLAKRHFDDCAAIQYIFQDPYAALDAENTIEQVLDETTRLCRRNKRRDVLDATESLAMAGIDGIKDWRQRKIRSLSGGQRQKIAIARALIPKPELIIADESTAMLDITSGFEIADALSKINRAWGTSFIIISHQMDIIKKLCTEVAVMHDGTILEQGETLAISEHATNTRARKLMAAMNFFSGGI